MKRILIELQIKCGEYNFREFALIETKCKDERFAVEWYTSHYYSKGKRFPGDSYWWFYGEITVEWRRFKIIENNQEYLTLKHYLYGV